MRSRFSIFVAAVLIGCGPAPTAETPEGQPKGPTETKEQLRIGNGGQSTDVGLCHSKAPAFGDTVNKEALTGLLVAARPHVMECFVDPASRGPERETELLIKTTFGAGGLEHAVSGKNLTPSGEKCVVAAVGRYLGGIAAFSTQKPASPISAEAQYRHVAGVSPTVKLGQNEGSDVAGTLRLQQSAWCDCYAEWKDVPPKTLQAKIKLAKPAGKDGTKAAGTVTVSPAEITFTPPGDESSEKVAACLKGKMQALKFKLSADELSMPYTFVFLDSSFDGDLGGPVPELRFSQFELLRGQHAAEAVIAYGGARSAAEVYDGLVKQYKAKPASVTVDELKNKCAALLKADDGWIATLERQLAVDEKTLAMVQELKAKDPQWGKVETAVQANVAETKKDVENAKKARKGDEAACPKERY